MLRQGFITLSQSKGLRDFAVSNPLAERLASTPFSVHVMRIKIAGLSGVDNDIRLGNGSSDGLPNGAHLNNWLKLRKR